MRSLTGYALAAIGLWAATGAVATAPDEPGAICFVGDSITQGGPTPSYRYPLWKMFVDAGLVHEREYAFVGSQSGFHAGGKTAATPDHAGQSFPNVHEGHWGWRASWIAGATPLPKGRHSANNLGAGTAANWTGQTRSFATVDSGNVTYTGRTVRPDTVVLMIGINDLADGATAAAVAAHIRTIVGLYQAANPAVRVHVCSTLPVSPRHAKAARINPRVEELATLLGREARLWSTRRSRVGFVDLRPGFDAAAMTYDNTHPTEAGESVIAANLAGAFGIGTTRPGASGTSDAGAKR